MDLDLAVVVFSHLRWGFVYQRPQHILSRIAKKHSVLFVEEPILSDTCQLTVANPAENVWVLQPRTTLPQPGFTGEQIALIAPLLNSFFDRQRIKRTWLWFYTPMATPLLERLRLPDPEHVVYDCMDELSAFRFAPAELPSLEHQLMARATAVFTGGRSLFQSKRERYPNALCFPSSVDVAHFQKHHGEEPADQVGIGRPRFGYCGVIDERVNLELVVAMADRQPDWNIVLVGPVVKIDPGTLPRRPNIHYLGQKSYHDLPAYIGSWDVCLLPFARNESTRYISPTKTLEYLAAEKPVVSTLIEDVVFTFGDVLWFGESADEWLTACHAAISASSKELAARKERAAAILNRTSWDRTVASMLRILEPPAPNSLTRALLSDGKLRTDVAIVGAGPTGLSAAYHLGDRAALIEKNSTVGGWCRSIVDRGFTFDFAGHIMFSNDSYVHELYKRLLGENVHWQNREAWVFSKGVYTRYPFQSSLHGLPPETIEECIVGAIEARFGPLEAEPTSRCASPRAQAVNGDGKDFSFADCCADGAFDPAASSSRNGSREPRNSEEFIYNVWGAGIAKHFAVPYNQKLWGVPLSTMETSWLGGRVPLPDLRQIVRGAVSPSRPDVGPNARFGYPLRGGFQALMNGFLPWLKGLLLLNREVRQIDPLNREIVLSDGTLTYYRHLISTMPLPQLIRAMGPHAPEAVRRAAEQLRHVSVRCVNLGVGREKLTEKHWIYYPESTVFHRIFVQGNASPYCNPKGGFGLCCEITYSPEKPLPCDGDALTELCIDDCRRTGIIQSEDPILTSNQLDLPYAYVIYDHARRRHIDTVREWLRTLDITLAGRYSEWEYYNSDHAFLAGQRAAAEAETHLEKERDGSRPARAATRGVTSRAAACR